MITYARSKGISAALSSNLSMRADLASIVQARPDFFRISLSGTGATYEIIHRGGNWKLVEANMRELSVLRARLHPEMNVEVNFHIYNHNKTDLPVLAGLCAELGFTLKASQGMIYPLEYLLDYLEFDRANDLFREGLARLDFVFDQRKRTTKKFKECAWDYEILIGSDRSVHGCVEIYDHPDNVIAKDFLSIPLDEIVSAKKRMPICSRCKRVNAFQFQCSEVLDASGRFADEP